MPNWLLVRSPEAAIQTAHRADGRQLPLLAPANLRILVPILAWATFCSLPRGVHAQGELHPRSTGIVWRLAPFLGYAQHSPVGEEWGVTPDWNHLFLGIHLETSVLRLRSVTLSYAPVVVPLLLLTHHPPDPNSAQKPVYAIGVAPFGLKLAIDVLGEHQVFGSSAVGGVWSTRPIPIPSARAFNVSLEWGGGVDIAVAKRHSLQMGYKFHHLSNAYTATTNPGLDGHVLFAGWRFTTCLGR